MWSKNQSIARRALAYAEQREANTPRRKKFEIVLDSDELKWFYMSCAAALPQLDRGSDYESERHRFESYTPHQLKLKASGNGGFSFMETPHGFEPRSRREREADAERP